MGHFPVPTPYLVFVRKAKKTLQMTIVVPRSPPLFLPIRWGPPSYIDHPLAFNFLVYLRFSNKPPTASPVSPCSLALVILAKKAKLARTGSVPKLDRRFRPDAADAWAQKVD